MEVLDEWDEPPRLEIASSIVGLLRIEVALVDAVCLTESSEASGYFLRVVQLLECVEEPLLAVECVLGVVPSFAHD